MKDKFIRTAIIVLGFLTGFGCLGQDKFTEFNYKDLLEKKQWQIVKKDVSEHHAHIKLKNQKWLMYFIHWCGLTNENKNISGEYASNLLQNLWGMQFEVTDNQGECAVNGHKAYYAEAMLRNTVKTRFIVWNCEETNRQFIADCNINIALKTPEEFFTIQTEVITPGFCCHQSPGCNTDAMQKQIIIYEDLNICFCLPKEWRSAKFLLARDTSRKIPGYYPDGVTKEKGSLWNLTTDSEKQIDILWKKSDNALSKNMLTAFFDEVIGDTTIEMKDTVQYISVYNNFQSNEIDVEEGLIKAEGTYEINLDIPAYKSKETNQYQYKAFLWKENNTFYFILASMVAYTQVWGQPFDLAPSEKTFNQFINQIFEKP